ncbi:MAG: magnesium chelatase domain-containing protein, partial [Agathobaculum sp.]
MVSRVFSAGLSGIDGYIVTAECFLSGGLPRLDVVGLPTGAVSEAGERVRAAAKACAFDWPVSRVTVNLAPADTKKAGTAYDLPILLAILAAAGEVDAPPQDAIFFGELSLTGALRPVCGALSMALAARDAGFRTVFVPAQNAAEASYAAGVTIVPVSDLNGLL